MPEIDIEYADPTVEWVRTPYSNRAELVIEQEAVHITVTKNEQTDDSSEMWLDIETTPGVVEFEHMSVDPTLFLQKSQVDLPGGVISYDHAQLVLQQIANVLTTAPYIHQQTVANTSWVVEHQLGYDPSSILLIDDEGAVIRGFSVQYITPGQTLLVSHDIPAAGIARVR